jgi:hypothetical protein
MSLAASHQLEKKSEAKVNVQIDWAALTKVGAGKAAKITDDDPVEAKILSVKRLALAPKNGRNTT